MKHSINKKILLFFTAFFIICALLVSLCAAVSASALDSSGLTEVRIACGINDSLYLDDDGKVQGKCAEYLKELASVNNWKYKYVNGNWTECYQKFLNGDIDILFPIQKNEKREELMNFSSLIGGYQVVAMFAKDSSDCCYEDFDYFNNKRIAVTPDSSNANVLKNYADENGFSYYSVDIESTEDKVVAINDGDVDFAVFSTLNSPDELSMVATLDAVPFYYAVSKENDSLLAKLNQGMKTLLVQQPDLVKQVISDTAASNCKVAYTSAESECIKKTDKIIVGFYKDTAPLCEVHNDGNFQGIYIELMNRVSEISGLDIELYPIDRSQYGLDLVRDGTVDFIIGSSDIALKSMNITDLTETATVLDYNTVAVTQQKYQFTNSSAPVFALTSARKYWENYLYSTYPNATVVYYESALECLNAVWKGDADVTLLNTIEYNYQSKNPRFSGLIEWESFRMKSGTVMVCSADIEPSLLSVVNKTLRRITEAEVSDTVNYYLNIPYHSFTFQDTLYNARVPALIVLIVALIFLTVSVMIARIKKKSYVLLEEKNSELIKANAAKTDFLSRMSHDMRTPMNGILGLTELMKDKSDITEIREDLEQIKYSGKYLLNLINDTLDMNKIESGKLELHPEPINSEDLFFSILVNAQTLAKEKGINLKIETPDIPHSQWKPVIADAPRIQQVLINIISNAIKYTPEGGTVELIMKTVSISDATVIDRYIIRDNGIGMSEDFLPHIYDSFSQEGRIGTDRQTGTGLGMAIVKQLVDLMGGSISVKSKINEGTEFTLVLHYKVYHGEIEKKGTPVYQDEILKGKRVLLCEDHPLNTKIAKQLLEKKGMLVDTAANGKIGVERVIASSQGYYDLILMDIRMPEMDGIEATKQIRALNHPDAKSIPIIAMTANAFDEDRELTRKAGMNAHLSKPIETDAMYSTLARLLASHGDKKK